jgi:carboxymethylenebutenolidase
LVACRYDHSAARTFKEIIVISQDLSIVVDGTAMPCYLARLEGGDPKPAVIVLQEIFGVNREVKRIADLFASAGYVALAPNYYYRTHPTLNEPYTPEGLQSGFAAAGRVTRANLRADIGGAIAWLNSQTFVVKDKIATCGFCYGGTVAFLSATMPGVTAAIAFYGGAIANQMASGEPEALVDSSDVRAPILLFFGGQDDYIPASAVERIDRRLTDAGKEHEVVVYPNVGHAFFRESSAKLNSHEVADAWSRVQSFLKAELA